MYEIYQKLLDSRNLKNADISRATGISNMTLSDWKRGKSTPKQDKLQKIADYFGVSIEYLMTGKEPTIDSSAQVYYIDEETARTAQEIYNNDKILFDVYKTADKDRLIAYAKKLSELRKLEEGEE